MDKPIALKQMISNVMMYMLMNDMSGHNLRSSLISQTLLRIYEILFSKPMILPCVNTTSIYSLYNFSSALMMRSNVRISWFIGFYNAYSKAFLFDCNCQTCPRSAATSWSLYPHKAKTERCSCRTCFSSALADYSYNPLPQFFDSYPYSISLRSVAVLSRVVKSVLVASNFCAFSERDAIQRFSFLMNQVFSSLYFLISVLDRSYLSMIFLDFNYFSLSQSAIFSKLSLSSSNFFFNVSISFSFCCTFVLYTASFFSPSASWFFKFSTYGLVEFDSICLIYSNIFFSSFRLVASWVFSNRSFSNFKFFSCKDFVYFVSNSVCCRRVVNISL